MGKKLIIGLVVALAIAIIGYFGMLKIEQINVENTVREIFNSLKSGENNSQKQDIIEGIKNSSEVEENTQNNFEYEILFSKLNYTIVDTKNDFKEATVVLNVTNKDMKTVLSNYLVKAFQLAFSSVFIPTYTDEQMQEELNNYLKEQIESDEVDEIMTNIELKMEKKDGKWVIKEESKKDFANAILPGFIDTLEQITDSFNQGID